MASDEQIIAALLSTGTIAQAAQAAQIAPRTIYKRMGTPAFKAAYSAARADLIRAAVTALNGHMAEAIEVVAEIMRDTSAPPSTRIQAARLILDNAARFADRLTEADRLTANSAQQPFEI